MNNYKVQQIEIKINNSNDRGLSENNQLLELHRSSVRNFGGLPTNFNDNLGACCCWSVVISVCGTIIGATIWCLVKY